MFSIFVLFDVLTFLKEFWPGRGLPSQGQPIYRDGYGLSQGHVSHLQTNESQEVYSPLSNSHIPIPYFPCPKSTQVPGNQRPPIQPKAHQNYSTMHSKLFTLSCFAFCTEIPMKSPSQSFPLTSFLTGQNLIPSCELAWHDVPPLEKCM